MRSAKLCKNRWHSTCRRYKNPNLIYPHQPQGRPQMKRIFLLFATCLLAICVLPLAYAANSERSPLGYWKTIDDVTGETKSILHIYQANNALYGKVVKIFPKPGHDQNEVCSACKGNRHNQPILGMVIMEGLKQNAANTAEWSGGQIIDPTNGKIYRCLITLTNNGENLKVRGYIGMALFGRSQTWARVPNAK